MKHSCFTLHENFTYLAEMTNLFLSHVKEHGLINYFDRKQEVLLKMSDFAKRISPVYEDHPVSLLDLEMVFVIWLFGIITSIVFFFGEILTFTFDGNKTKWRIF